MDRIVDFAEGAGRAPSVGPKASSLARLHDAGFPIPAAFFILGEAYRAHIDSNNLLPLITSRIRELTDRDPDPETIPTPETALAEIRHAICSAPLDPRLAAQIRGRHIALGRRPMAVRSSGTAEDLPGHSFAGQHGTYFAVDEDELLEHVKHCWASLWTDRAFTYRARQGFDHLSVDMAVIVQVLVPAEISGVAFTTDPVSGEDRVIVEACLGLGEALVSGKVTPDRWVFTHPGLELLQHSIATKTVQVVAVSGDRVAEQEIAAESQDQPATDDAMARRVAEYALAVEDLFGEKIDMEWAVVEEKVWLLQARPVTGLPAVVESGERPYVWSNANVGEVLPDVVSPMNWSILETFIQEMLVGMFGKMGVSIADEETVRLIGGRAYFNISVLAAAFRAIPSATPFDLSDPVDLSEILGGMQDTVDIPPEMLEYEIDAIYGSTWRTIKSVPGLLRYMVRHSPRRSIPFCEAARATTDDALGLLDGGTDDELTERLRFIVQDLSFMADGLGFAGAAMSYFSSLSVLTRRWLGEEDRGLVTGMMMGQGGVVSADAGLALWDLAARARKEPKVQRALLSAWTWDSARERLETMGDEGRLFLEAWDDFMREYGHRSRGELEVANARWVERPEYVLGLVRAYMDATGEKDLLAEYAEHRAQADRLATEARARLRNPFKRAIFGYLLRQSREGAGARERVKGEGVRRMAAARWMFLELSQRMVDRGLLESADDIFFLTWDEWDDVRQMTSTMDTDQVIAERRAAYEHHKTLSPPPVIIGDWDPNSTLSLLLDDDVRVLSGLGVSPGVVRGPARVIASVDDHEEVLPGEILVAPFTDPGWTPYFLPAAGIVMNMGGMLSHGSIIAREYGIPAVVNVGPATTVIETGDLVEVDGTKGEVRLVEE